MSTITILIGKIAAPLKQRRVKKGTTLSNFLLMLSLPKDKYDDVKINGNKLPLNTELNDRDIVTIISNVSGAATVKRFGGPWRVHLNDSDKIFPSNFHAHYLQTN